MGESQNRNNNMYFHQSCRSIRVLRQKLLQSLCLVFLSNFLVTCMEVSKLDQNAVNNVKLENSDVCLRDVSLKTGLQGDVIRKGLEAILADMETSYDDLSNLILFVNMISITMLAIMSVSVLCALVSLLLPFFIIYILNRNSTVEQDILKIIENVTTI